MGLSLTHKLLSKYIVEGKIQTGEEIGIDIEQILIQDHNGTQLFLYLEALGIERIKDKLVVCYIDHNVLQLNPENIEDQQYLKSSASKYGVIFVKPATGISHQLHLENFAKPGSTLLGTDSHTTHCGSVGMLALAAGSLDVAAVLAGTPYFLKVPRILNIHLRAKLNPWCSAKDISLELLRLLKVNGGIGKIIEFTGPGTKNLNVQQRAVITNMCTELGATSGIFPSDEVTYDFYERMGRKEDWKELKPDEDSYYDEHLELDLSTIEPLIALPGMPDNIVPVREVAGTKIQQVMVGSCTNGSYFDLAILASVMKGRGVHPEVNFFIHPSTQNAIKLLIQGDYLQVLIDSGIELSSSTCGACIGLGHIPSSNINSLRTINRNFKGRSGQYDDYVYLCSPETAAASAIKGEIIDPRDFAKELNIRAPQLCLPESNNQNKNNFIFPIISTKVNSSSVQKSKNIVPTKFRNPISEYLTGKVLIKLGNNISTDDILPASAESLKYRSNASKISSYMFHRLDPKFSERANDCNGGWILAGSNYGQGSSREHAALATMILQIVGVLAVSFARIHYNNLINCGIIPCTFENPDDYYEIKENEALSLKTKQLNVASNLLIISSQNTNKNYRFRIDLTPRQLKIIKLGNLLAFNKNVRKN